MKQSGQQSSNRHEFGDVSSFFTCSPTDAGKIRKSALAKLRRKFSTSADAIGLKGEGYRNCLEDWVNEAYIRAQERYHKWDPSQGGPDQWVYLNGKDIAHRWFERLFTEYRKIRQLHQNGSSLVHDGEQAAKDHNEVYGESQFILEILHKDLSDSDSRILKLHLRGHSIEEVADSEGLSKQTAQRRLNRAQARARNARHKRDSAVLPLLAKVSKSQRRPSP